MKLFDSTNVCPKCLVVATFKWVAEQQVPPNRLGEAMMRECTLCGYVWYEFPLDHKDNP